MSEIKKYKDNKLYISDVKAKKIYFKDNVVKKLYVNDIQVYADIEYLMNTYFSISNLVWASSSSRTMNLSISSPFAGKLTILGKINENDSNWATIKENITSWATESDLWNGSVSFDNFPSYSQAYHYIRVIQYSSTYNTNFYSNILTISDPKAYLKAPTIYSASYDYVANNLYIKFRENNGYLLTVNIYTNDGTTNWHQVTSFTQNAEETMEKNYTVDPSYVVNNKQVKVEVVPTDTVLYQSIFDVGAITIVYSQFPSSAFEISKADFEYNTNAFYAGIKNNFGSVVSMHIVVTNSNGTKIGDWTENLPTSVLGTVINNTIQYSNTGKISITFSKLGYEDYTITKEFTSSYYYYNSLIKASNLRWVDNSSRDMYIDFQSGSNTSPVVLGRTDANSTNWVELTTDSSNFVKDTSNTWAGTLQFTNKKVINDTTYLYRYIKVVQNLDNYNYYSSELTIPTRSLTAPIINEATYNYSTKNLYIKFREDNGVSMQIYIYTNYDGNWQLIENIAHGYAAEYITKNYTVDPKYLSNKQIKVVFHTSDETFSDVEAISSVSCTLVAPVTTTTFQPNTDPDSVTNGYFNVQITNNNAVSVTKKTIIYKGNTQIATSNNIMDSGETSTYGVSVSNLSAADYYIDTTFSYNNVNSSETTNSISLSTSSYLKVVAWETAHYYTSSKQLKITFTQSGGSALVCYVYMQVYNSTAQTWSNRLCGKLTNITANTTYTYYNQNPNQNTCICYFVFVEDGKLPYMVNRYAAID